MAINLLDFDYTQYPLNVFKNQKCIDFLGQMTSKNAETSLNPLEKMSASAVNKGLSFASGMQLASLVSEYKLAKMAESLYEELPAYAYQIVGNFKNDPSLLISDTREWLGIMYMVSRTLYEMENDAISTNLDDIGSFVVRYVKSGNWGLKGAWQAFTGALDEAANKRRFIYSEISRIYTLSILLNYYVEICDKIPQTTINLIKHIVLDLSMSDSNKEAYSTAGDVKYYIFDKPMSTIFPKNKNQSIKNYVEENIKLFEHFVHPKEECDSKILLWAKTYYDKKISSNRSEII